MQVKPRITVNNKKMISSCCKYGQMFLQYIPNTNMRYSLCLFVSRYLFQIGVKHVSVSLPVLTTVQDQIRSMVATCCSGSNDTTACLKVGLDNQHGDACLQICLNNQQQWVYMIITGCSILKDRNTGSSQNRKYITGYD